MVEAVRIRYVLSLGSMPRMPIPEALDVRFNYCRSEVSHENLATVDGLRRVDSERRERRGVELRRNCTELHTVRSTR